MEKTGFDHKRLKIVIHSAWSLNPIHHTYDECDHIHHTCEECDLWRMLPYKAFGYRRTDGRQTDLAGRG